MKKHTPMKQTNSSLQTVLLALLLEGGHLGPEPSQKAESRQPLSSRHLTPYLSWQDSVQHGPCVVIIVIDLTCKTNDSETQMVLPETVNRWSMAAVCKVFLPAAGYCALGNSTFLGNLLPIRNRILHPLPPLRCRKWHSGAL